MEENAIDQYWKNIRKNNEAAKGTVLLLRQIIPEEMRKAVTKVVDVEKLKKMQSRKYFNTPMLRIAYASGRTDGMFGTILSLLLEQKKPRTENLKY